MSINLTLGAIVVLLAGLVLNFKSSKERQENAEYTNHAQEVTPLQAGAPFSVFLTFFAAYEIKENADNDGGNRAVD